MTNRDLGRVGDGRVAMLVDTTAGSSGADLRA